MRCKINGHIWNPIARHRSRCSVCGCEKNEKDVDRGITRYEYRSEKFVTNVVTAGLDPNGRQKYKSSIYSVPKDEVYYCPHIHVSSESAERCGAGMFSRLK